MYCAIGEIHFTSLYECNDTESGVHEEREPESRMSAEFGDCPGCKQTHPLHVLAFV